MIICVIFAVFSVSIIGTGAEPDNEVKRGIFTFMGFIYYQDASVITESGHRFIRGAVLIRPNWLISASLDRTEAPLAFPQKTLLARFGGVAIDANIDFNEDEEEQEREVIQVVQPNNFSATQWWFHDISLLKTLLPFNITSAVTPIAPHYRQDLNVTSCKILLYSRRSYNVSEERILMQLSVELLSPSTDCGLHFKPDTMICAADSDDNKSFSYEQDYCQGNGGGPLLCEGEVIALQTYINDNCNQPHLFQLLAAWEKFIDCGVKESCLENHCNATCTTLNKDTLINEIVVATDTTTDIVTVITESEPDTKYLVTAKESQPTVRETDSVSETETASETEKFGEDNEEVTPPTLTTTTSLPSTMPTKTTTETTLSDKLNEDETTTWSSVKVSENSGGPDRSDDSDNVARQANVEAQQQMIVARARGVANIVELSPSPLCLLVFHVIAVVQ